MSSSRFKSVLPKSLFGRALLILMIPIIALQLVVGLVFFQRHYTRVTEQLTRGVAQELRYVVEVIEVSTGPDAAAALLPSVGAALDLGLRLDAGAAVSPGARRRALDATGGTAIATLQEALARPISVDLLGDPRNAEIGIQTAQGVLYAVAPRNRLTVTNPHQLLVLMLLAAILLTTIAVLFLRNQVRPIRALAEAAEDFGKGRSTAFRTAGAEEVRRAGMAFLAMRSRLERQIEQRTQMLSGVSHDLRTPLTRMKLTLALMEDSEETRDLAQDLDQMDRMLGEFLAFARGDVLEETTDTDAVALARGVVEDARRAGTEVALETEGSSGAAMVALRFGAVTRALQNLVGNAMRHGELVRITVRLKPRRVDFVVEDDGPGIPVADRERALQPFTRLDPARSQNAGGHVGLGLSIAMDVARSHGGVLDLGESADLGGLKAVLRLPR